jgi:hypothetical protein
LLYGCDVVVFHGDRLPPHVASCAPAQAARLCHTKHMQGQ